MTTRGIRTTATETALFVGDLAWLAGVILACRLFGHPDPLAWQDMSHGAVGVCRRCASTVVLPVAKVP